MWSLACQAGREEDFWYFDLRRPLESHTYSPLLNGTANEQVDKIMAALRWDNEYYRTQSKSVLLRILRSLRATGVPYTLEDVLAALSEPAALRTLASEVHDPARRDELEHVAGRWKEYQVETSGLRSQLEALLMTDFGQLLKAPLPTLDLAEAYRSGAIVYFALPVARFPETAPLVAKLVISDLNSVAGMVQDGHRPGEARPSRHLQVPAVLAAAAGRAVDGARPQEARCSGRAEFAEHGCARDDVVRGGLVSPRTR